MQGAFAQGILFVLGLATAATAFILVVFAANSLLSPRNPGADKDSPFECGMEQAGEAWVPPRMRFSTIAMLFVLFDAEAILLFAVASALRGSLIALLEVGSFVAFLAFGLVYAWRKGALEWRS
jgi:NADH:ubiquinone oxidoreductase subunit 3 (subunit A)